MFSSRFDALSPLDSRYWDETLAGTLSDRAFLKYKLLVEVALVETLADRGICSREIANEISEAAETVSCEEVAAEESRIRHDIRALANVLRSKVSEAAKPFVHWTATSYDIIDSARSLQYRDALTELFDRLMKLEDALITIAEREAETAQIGRTHGQHAVPITFGFAIAQYVSRLGNSMSAIWDLHGRIPAKMSGAVGAYNAASLFMPDPEAFEREVLKKLYGREPAEISTQIVAPDHLARLLAEVGIAAGVMANLADDMRQLQRSEIAEVGEAVSADQVGSSTMPHKRNPIAFENVKSLYKVIVGRLVTVQLDLVSEHQRDLTNSASARTVAEIIAYAAVMASRLGETMSKLVVDRQAMFRNLQAGSRRIAAEPLYLALASLGHPDAHEAVRKLEQSAATKEIHVADAALADPEIAPYFELIPERQLMAIRESTYFYRGKAAEKARQVAANWREKFVW